MAYIRPCNKCGQRISMREMRAGQWVAFDVSTEQPHKCGKKNKADPKIIKLAKEKSKIKENGSEGIDLGYDDVTEENNLKETFSTNSTINKKIDEAIKKKNRIFIDYNSEFNQEMTSREISPIKKFKYKNRNYIQAYCHLRKDQRSFLIKSILNLQPLEKTRFKPKNLKKPNIADFSKKYEEGKEGIYEDSQTNNDNFDQPVPNYDNQRAQEEPESKLRWWHYLLIFYAFVLINYFLGCPFYNCD